MAIEFDGMLTATGRGSGLAAALEITRTVLYQFEAHPTRGLVTQIVLADPRRDHALSGAIANLRDKTLPLFSRHIENGIIDSWLAGPCFDIAAAGDQLMDLVEHGLRNQARDPQHRLD